MNLTPRQQRLIRRLVTWHTQPPTAARLAGRVAAMLLAWAVILFGCVLLSGGATSSFIPYAIGIFTGLLGANLAFVRLTLALWPVYNQIIDWSKVEALVIVVEPPGA